MESSEGRCSRAYGSGVIGLDFGSTHSAAAVAIPTEHASISETKFDIVRKFATKILVKDPDEPSFAFIAPGECMEPADRELPYLKPLLLDFLREQPGDPAVQGHCIASVQGLDLPEDPNVVSIFLKGLWGEARKILGRCPRRTYGPPHVVVAYPGNWNRSERDRLRSAVRSAGIENECCQVCGVQYCTEQAAAVHAALFDHPGRLHPYRQNGDSIIAADCGGLTLDAATYDFHSSHSLLNSTSVGGIADVESSFIGGLSLDLAFDAMVEEKLKRVAQRSDHQLMLSSVEGKARARDIFEREIKPRFGIRNSNAYDDVWRVDEAGGYQVILDRADIVRVYDPLITKIVDHIVKLYTRAKDRGKQPKVVILTGGVSQSPRIQNWVRKKLKKVDSGLELIVSGQFEAKHAVCRGAVLALLTEGPAR